MKYIVMECHRAYALLLDEDGKVVKAANMNYSVGQTVTDPVLMKKISPSVWINAAAIIAACLILVFGFGYYQNNFYCYSSITMSINPEVRIELNRKGEVIDVVGTNADGTELVKDYEHKGKDKVTVADELIERAIAMGYLQNAGDIEFDINSPDQKLLEEYGDEISRQVTAYLSGIFDGANPNVSGGHITITIEFKPAGSGNQSGTEAPGGNDAAGGSEAPPASGNITADEAKGIALNNAGLSAESVVFNEVSLDDDDEISVYEIEFTANGYEYEYKIDAKTGAILESERDPIDD